MILRTLRRLVAFAPRRERVAAPIFAVLLLTTAVGAPIGTAAAATTTEECSGVDAIIYDMVVIGNFSVVDTSDHPCSPRYLRAQAIEELKNASAQQEELDIYNGALAQKANTENRFAIQSNYMNDSRPVAWMHAETAIANAYKNGASKAVAKSKARQAIADYYSARMINYIKSWNTTIQSYHTMKMVAVNQSGISNQYLSFTGYSTNYDFNEESHTYHGMDQESLTLPNGSTAYYKTLVFEMSNDYNAGTPQGEFTIFGGSTPESNAGTYYFEDLIVKAPDSNYDRLTYLKSSEWGSKVNEMNTLNNDLQAEVDPFVNGTWSAFQDGQINASDVISRNNLMFRYGTDALNNTNQSLYDSTAALASMGVAVPNLSSTGLMTVQYNNVTYQGMVLAETAPNGTWQTGTTYNTSNIGGVVMLATSDGRRIDMTGNFTISEMQNQQGEHIQETSATKVVYKTANTTELLNKMAQIIELRKQYESTKPKAGGGATSDGGGSDLLKQLAALLGISSGMALIVLAGAGLVVYKVYTP